MIHVVVCVENVGWFCLSESFGCECKFRRIKLFIVDFAYREECVVYLQKIKFWMMFLSLFVTV